MALSKSQIKKIRKYEELYLIILDDEYNSEKSIPDKYKNKIIKSEKFSDFLLLTKKEVEDFARYYEFEDDSDYIFAFPDVIPHTMSDIEKLIYDYENDFLKTDINKEGKVEGNTYYMIDVTNRFI